MKHIATGNIASVMAPHTIGQGNEVTVDRQQIHLTFYIVIANIVGTDEYHIFII
jgi:hypothetical protein